MIRGTDEATGMWQCIERIDDLDRKRYNKI